MRESELISYDGDTAFVLSLMVVGLGLALIAVLLILPRLAGWF
jgi:hypothetical protein